MGNMESDRLALVLFLSAMLAAGAFSCKKNHPPDVPSVHAEGETGIKDTAYTFRATTADPDGDSVAIRFCWGQGSNTYWSDLMASGDTATFYHTWEDTGTFEVTAQARDVKDALSSWSTGRMMLIGLAYPPNPPATPYGDTSGLPDSTLSFMTWATDPDSDSVAIRFDWGDGDSSDWSGFVASGETVTMSHAWSSPGRFFVKAQARDQGRGFSLWSEVLTVEIEPPDTMILWRFRTFGSLRACPAIGSDGTIYVGSADSGFYAVNPDGNLKWRLPGLARTTYSSPAIGPDGTAYVGSTDDCLYAINPDGTLKWRYQTGGDVRSSPAVAADGTIYVGSYDGYFYAVNPDSTLRFRFWAGGQIRSSPAIGIDGTIYIGSDAYVCAFNPDSTVKWRYGIGKDVRGSPAISADGSIYVTSAYDSLHALDPNGTLKWSYPTGSDLEYSSPAVGPDGTIYVGSEDDHLYALSPDGVLRWRCETGSGTDLSTPAICSNGTVYVGTYKGYLYAVGPDGILKWTYKAGGKVYSPTIGPDGKVYFVCSDGYLYATKGTSPLADSPWPKFHHDLRNTGRAGAR